MAPDATLHDLLRGLLVTHPEALRFVFLAVFGSQPLPNTPEEAVAALHAEVQRHRDLAPGPLITWLNSARPNAPLHLLHLLRLAAFYRDERLVQPLHTILKQLPLAHVHPAAVRALAANSGANATFRLLALLRENPPPQWHVREPAALLELGRLGDPAAIPELLRALDVPFANATGAATQALAAYPPDLALEPLLRTLRTADNPRVATHAAEALGLLKDARALGALQRASEGIDPGLAVAAAVALARLNDPDAPQRLLRLAQSNTVRVRASALGALALTPSATLEGSRGRDLFNALTQGLTDPQPEVRSAAAFALGHLKRAGASPPVEAALRAEVSPLVRAHMVRALGLLATPDGLELLTQRLAVEEVSVRVEILHALASSGRPEAALWISPYRASSERRLVEAANEALQRLLFRPFTWPEPKVPTQPVVIALYAIEGARERLLPPPPPAAPPSFFGRLFGARTPAPPPPPSPIGELHLSEDGLRLILGAGDASAFISWDRAFSLQITREPAPAQASQDIGVHFTLRQREDDLGTRFQTVAVSLWCAPSEALGPFQPKSERLPCLDPYHAEPLLAALRYYARAYGVPIPGL